MPLLHVYSGDDRPPQRGSAHHLRTNVEANPRACFEVDAPVQGSLSLLARFQTPNNRCVMAVYLQMERPNAPAFLYARRVC